MWVLAHRQGALGGGGARGAPPALGGGAPPPPGVGGGGGGWPPPASPLAARSVVPVAASKHGSPAAYAEHLTVRIEEGRACRLPSLT